MFRLLFLLLSFVFCVTANKKECPTRSFIEKSLLDVHIPGAVMIVINNNDILYQEAFGHQAFSPTQLMDVNKSIFVLASISKTFIAVSVMQLVESNLLDLDTDINKYLLPSDPHISHPLYPSHLITLRHLLSHSASIGNNDEAESSFFQSDDKALTETTLAAACFSYLSDNASNWLSKPPGSVTLYSNVGSAFAALVVERVANISYEEYVRQKILKPLGIDIKQAGFRLSNIEDQENLVKHYSFNTSHLEKWSKMTPSLNITKVNAFSYNNHS
jgi:CubicO group peptidase (beta-lactamase class C family)